MGIYHSLWLNLTVAKSSSRVLILECSDMCVSSVLAAIVIWLLGRVQELEEVGLLTLGSRCAELGVLAHLIV